jgi:DNA-directed RNA polymerase subunit beta'
MLASHNILNPCKWCSNYGTFSGWFGSILYDQRTFVNSEKKILGQDLTFYSAEEVNIALNEG